MTALEIIAPDALDELAAILSDPAAMAAKLRELADAARSEHAEALASIDRAMEKLLTEKAEAAAEHAEREAAYAAREHALRLRENALVVAERELAAERRRISDRERTVEMRAADMQVRYAGAK